MAQAGRWLWGLVPLALLWGAGNLFLAESIENDIAMRAQQVAGAAAGSAPGARPVMARVEGRDVEIAGEALTEDGAARALSQLKAEFGVRRVLGGLTQVVAQKPYSWNASIGDGRLLLSGHVPDMDLAAANVAAAREARPDLQIVDRQTAAFGAPDGFGAITNLLIGELRRLSRGKVGIDDLRYCVEGVAATPEDFDALLDLPARVSGKFEAVSCGLEPPTVSPFRWSLEKLENGGLLMSGFRPPGDATARIAEAIRRAFPAPITLADETRPAAGAPQALLAKIERAAKDLARLRHGRVEIMGDSYQISGAGPDDHEACIALQLQIAQGDGPDSVAQASITCPPAPPPVVVPLPEMPPLILPEPVEAQAKGQPDVSMPAPVAEEAVPQPKAPPPVEVPLPEMPPLVLPERVEAQAKEQRDVSMPAPVAGEAVPQPKPETAQGAPLSWSATLTDGRITLRGIANDAGQKEALIAALRPLFPTAAIDDQLQIATLDGGIDFEAATRLALAALAKLGAGTVAITDGKLTVDGMVAGAASRRDLAALLSPSALPPALSLATDPAALPLHPYELSIVRDGQSLRLTGQVPDEATRQAIAALAKAATSKPGVEDGTLVVADAPQNFGSMALAAVTNLLRLDFGTAELSREGLELRGMTCRELIQKEVETAAKSDVPPGFKVDVAIGLRQTGCTVDPPNTCQADLDDLTKRSTVLFGQATTVLGSDAETDRVVAEAAAILRKCPDARITIEGHANHDGEHRRFDNLSLSTRRAQRVHDELVRRGIPPAQLSVKGYGVTRPLLPREDRDARASNRRVQFTVAK